MNKSKLLVGTLVLSAIAGGVYISKNCSTSDNPTYSTVQFVSEEEILNEKLSNEARAYWELLHTNVNTGQVEPSDYEEARKIAMSIPSAKSSFVLTEVGPDNVGGRTRAIEIDPTNESIVYAGSVSGGLFKSTDAGNNWTRVQGFDNDVPVLSISSIAITTDGTVYVAAGFNDFSDGFQTCEGLYYSNDDGDTWSQVSGTSNKCVNKVIADRSQNNVIYYTAGSGQYLNKVENGNTPSPTSSQIGNSDGITVQGSAGRDIKLSPDGQHLLYLSANRAYVSNDGGTSFTDVTGNGSGQVNATGMNRLEGAVSFDKNSNGNYAMNIIMSNGGNWGGSYYSEDNGVTWTQTSPKFVDNPNNPNQFNPTNSGGLSPQGNYDLVCTFVPGDPNTVVLGGIDLYRWRKTPSSNPISGQFEQITFWYLNPSLPNYVHADNHRLTWNSSGNLYVGNDGGVQISIDTSLSVFAASNKGYNVTQFYGMAHSPSGVVMGGTQDNGSLMSVDLGVGKAFREVGGGDGFDSEMSQLEDGAFIYTIYQSQVFRARSYTSGAAPIYAPCGTGVHGQSCGTFHTVVRLFEDDNDMNSQDSVMFVADSNIAAGAALQYLSSNFEKELSATAPTALSAGDTLMLQDPVQSLFATCTGTGLYVTRDVWRFGGSLNYSLVFNSSSVSALEWSNDGNTLWVGTYGGALTRISGFDSCYTDASMNIDSAASPNYKLEIITASSGSGTITDISVDKNDPNKVAFVRAGSGAGSNIQYSSNAESASPSFAAKDGNLPTYVTYGVELIEDPSSSVTMAVGTEFGLYVTTSSLSGTPTWTSCNDEMGHTPVYDVRQQHGEFGDFGTVTAPGRVYIGTFGRGIWWTDDVAGLKPTPDYDNISSDAPISNIDIFPNPVQNEGNIKFSLRETSDVTVGIYNLQGKLIKSMNLRQIVGGDHNITFNVGEFANGTYIMTFETGEHREVKKFIKR